MLAIAIIDVAALAAMVVFSIVSYRSLFYADRRRICVMGIFVCTLIAVGCNFAAAARAAMV